MPTRVILEMKGSLFGDRLPCIAIVIKAMIIRSAITLPLVERFIICINEGFSKMVNVIRISVAGGRQVAKTNDINGNSSVKQQLNTTIQKMLH